MSWQYGESSRANRDGCRAELIHVMNVGLSLCPVDVAIVRGWSGQDTQDQLFRVGASKLKWPNSKHNIVDANGDPWSHAFDFGPYVSGVAIPWEDTHIFALVAGVFMSAALDNGLRLRWGGDWDMDGLTTDQTFMDWGHLELYEESVR